MIMLDTGSREMIISGNVADELVIADTMHMIGAAKIESSDSTKAILPTVFSFLSLLFVKNLS